MPGRSLHICFCSLWSIATAIDCVALDVDQVTTHTTRDATAHSRSTSQILTRAESERAQTLRSGLRGLWTPHAEPLLMLGAHARSDAERQDLAERYVRQLHARVEGELAFERAVRAAWQRLFPNAQRLQLSAEPTSVTELIRQPAVRWALVLDRDRGAPSRLLAPWLERATMPNSPPLDLYVRGLAGDDSQLRTWAQSAGLPEALVEQARITLNHGDQYEGSAPLVFWQSTSGRWQRLAEPSR